MEFGPVRQNHQSDLWLRTAPMQLPCFLPIQYVSFTDMQTDHRLLKLRRPPAEKVAGCKQLLESRITKFSCKLSGSSTQDYITQDLVCARRQLSKSKCVEFKFSNSYWGFKFCLATFCACVIMIISVSLGYTDMR